MRKLTLSLEALKVESFEVSPALHTSGTVHGQRGTDVVTECIEHTCGDATCDGAETACVICEQQTATCMGGCGGGFSQVYTCLYVCSTPQPSYSCIQSPC